MSEKTKTVAIGIAGFAAGVAANRLIGASPAEVAVAGVAIMTPVLGALGVAALRQRCRKEGGNV